MELKGPDGQPKKTPELGDTEYTFPLSTFFTFLDMYTGKHKFYLTLEDQANQKIEKVLTITITE